MSFTADDISDINLPAIITRITSLLDDYTLDRRNVSRTHRDLVSKGGKKRTRRMPIAVPSLSLSLSSCLYPLSCHVWMPNDRRGLAETGLDLDFFCSVTLGEDIESSFSQALVLYSFSLSLFLSRVLSLIFSSLSLALTISRRLRLVDPVQRSSRFVLFQHPRGCKASPSQKLSRKTNANLLERREADPFSVPRRFFLFYSFSR